MRLPGWRGGPKDRRRAERIGGPALTAFYWTGGVCHPYRVRDISASGAYIETDEHWCVGTIVHLVLECSGSRQPSREAAETFGLWARIVRADSRGMGMKFIMTDRAEEREFQRFLETSARGLGVKPQPSSISAGERSVTD